MITREAQPLCEVVSTVEPRVSCPEVCCIREEVFSLKLLSVKTRHFVVLYDYNFVHVSNYISTQNLPVKRDKWVSGIIVIDRNPCRPEFFGLGVTARNNVIDGTCAGVSHILDDAYDLNT